MKTILTYNPIHDKSLIKEEKHTFNTLEMEVVLMNFFKPRVNVIVTNVSWGLFEHECDLIVCTKAGYVTEIEIKISLSDLKKDKEKSHNHTDGKISALYFAIPEKLEKHVEHIPQKSGIYVVRKRIRKSTKKEYYIVECIRGCTSPFTSRHKLSDKDMYQLARLGTMRILGLKEKLLYYKKK